MISFRAWVISFNESFLHVKKKQILKQDFASVPLRKKSFNRLTVSEGEKGFRVN